MPIRAPHLHSLTAAESDQHHTSKCLIAGHWKPGMAVPHRLGLGCLQQQRQRWRRRKPMLSQSLSIAQPAWGKSEVGLEKYSQSVELEVMRDSWVSAGGRVRQGEP